MKLRFAMKSMAKYKLRFIFFRHQRWLIYVERANCINLYNKYIKRYNWTGLIKYTNLKTTRMRFVVILFFMLPIHYPLLFIVIGPSDYVFFSHSRFVRDWVLSFRIVDVNILKVIMCQPKVVFPSILS